MEQLTPDFIDDLIDNVRMVRDKMKGQLAVVKFKCDNRDNLEVFKALFVYVEKQGDLTLLADNDYIYIQAREVNRP